MLTKTEQTVYKLNAAGKSYKEIADLLKITVETVKSHMKNLKLKKGLQKSSELTAYYWCEFFGASFEEQRKNILSACACLLVFFTLSADNFDKRRCRIRSREEYYESVEIYATA